MARGAQVAAAIDGPSMHNERLQALLSVLRADKLVRTEAQDLDAFDRAKAHGCLIERKTSEFHYIMCYALGCESLWSRPCGCPMSRTIADKRAAMDHIRDMHGFEVDA